MLQGCFQRRVLPKLAIRRALSGSKTALPGSSGSQSVSATSDGGPLYGLSAGPKVGGAGDGTALLAEHDLGGQHVGGISVHAEWRLGRCNGVCRVPQALHGQCREAGVSDRRWPSDPQGKDGQELNRVFGRHAQTLLPATVLAAFESG